MKIFTTKKTLFLSALALIVVATISSCSRGNDDDWRDAPNLEFIALSSDNQLIHYHAQQPETSKGATTVTGLSSGDRLLSIDFRPATGQLYAVSQQSRIYVINPTNGVATQIGASSFSPEISGDHVTIDFNPTVDRIRLVTNTGQNLRIHPETGVVVEVDGKLNGPSNPMIAGAAYTENFAGATTTTLFNIDVTSNKLYKQDPPNDGVLVEIGDLGVDVTAVNGFDIAAQQNVALALLEVDGNRSLYTVNLNSGTTTSVSTSMSVDIISVAIFTNPVAYAVDSENKLHIFNPLSTEQTITKDLTGMMSGESIVGIDFRSRTGALYALGNTNRIYIVNTSSGQLTRVGSMPFLPSFGIDMKFSFDFNPTADRIRIVTNTGMNLRVHPETGVLVATDNELNPGTPHVIAAGYTNSVPEASNDNNASTEMFVIDGSTNALYKQAPNEGTLTLIGNLGLTIEGTAGFDISAYTKMGYGLFTSAGQTRFYQINLQSGASQSLHVFPKPVRGFALGIGF